MSTGATGIVFVKNKVIRISHVDVKSMKCYIQVDLTVVFCLGLFLDDAEDIDDADDNRGPLGEVLFFDADDDAVSAFASLSQIDSVVIMYLKRCV